MHWHAGTILALLNSLDGFAIAADGRARRAGGVVSESEQKIFEASGPGVDLAYAVAGITNTASSEVPFDFRKQAAVEIESALRKQYADPVVFIERFSRRLNKVLEALESDLRKLFPEENSIFPDDDGEGSIAKILLAGFYGGRPVLSKVRFFQRRNRVASKPEVETILTPPPTACVIQGSQVIMNLLVQRDPRLRAFHSPAFLKIGDEDATLSLAEAQEAVRLLVEAQCSPEAREIAPAECASIGGHAHIATVTRDRGFQWVRPPTEAV